MDLAHAVIVRVTATEGSVPREPGTWMAVFPESIAGTIGGGHLEYEAIDTGRKILRGDLSVESRRVVLGPSLGQCCGGVVVLEFEQVTAADASRLETALAPQDMPVALFGGGHVGRALARILIMLPVQLTWIDSRDEIFPEDFESGSIGRVVCEHSDPVHLAVNDLAPGSRVLIMSFSHAEDLDVVAACLKRRRERTDLPWIGLIGSKTKWATFRARLRDRGFTDEDLAAVTCPIGIPGIEGKEPEVIAVAVAAQLLQDRRKP